MQDEDLHYKEVKQTTSAQTQSVSYCCCSHCCCHLISPRPTTTASDSHSLLLQPPNQTRLSVPHNYTLWYCKLVYLAPRNGAAGWDDSPVPASIICKTTAPGLQRSQTKEVRGGAKRKCWGGGITGCRAVCAVGGAEWCWSRGCKLLSRIRPTHSRAYLPALFVYLFLSLSLCSFMLVFTVTLVWIQHELQHSCSFSTALSESANHGAQRPRAV